MNHKPFMYIEQPDFKEVIAPMQAEYHSNTTVASHETKEAEKSSNKNTKFSDLTITEKIYYLLHLPREVPAIRCEIQTNNEKFRGIVIEEEAEAVVFRAFGKGYKTIRKDEITKIKLLGF